MKINHPCIITPRLLPGVQINDAFISIEYAGITSDNRDKYKIYLDTPTLEYEADDLASGVGGGTLQEGLESALGFMHACGESYAWQERHGKDDEDSNAKLFPKDVAAWCAANSDELSMLECELEETEGAIVGE